MVFDALQNADLYYSIGDNFEKALKFLEETDFVDVKPGRIDIDGDDVFAIVQEYSTKDPNEGKWEAHRKYVDIQYIIYGSEDLGFVHYEYLNPIDEYNEEKDIQFFEGDGDFLQLHEDEFVILFPHEAHMPGLAIEDSEKVRKVVVKIAV